MSLRTLTEADLENIIENTDDFGWPIVLTNPAGIATPYTGYSNDIADLIDPNTGQSVTGRHVSVALRISSLSELPRGIANKTIKPWLVSFTDTSLNDYTFKVIRSNPDRGLGIITLILEVYNGS